MKQARSCGDPPAWIVLAPSLENDAGPLPGEPSAVILPRRICAKPDRIAEAIRQASGRPNLTPDVMKHWRAAAVPEAELEPPFYVRRRIEREPEMPIAPLLLDYDQERCARLDLEPGESLDPVAEDLRIRVVTGVAGCGKTLVLLHRAALLAKHFPRARVQIVTHNRPLVADLGRRLRRLREKARYFGRTDCRTFFSWLKKVAPPRGEVLSPHETRRWIEIQLRSGNYPTLEKRSPEWIAEEMGWMFDHGLTGEDYVTAKRLGRGSGLREDPRREMLTLTSRYRIYLSDSGLADWSEWPLSVWERRSSIKNMPQIDHLLIDEAQFFAPIWLRLLRSCLSPTGHLFLCADPTQGFLRRRMSWADIGLPIRNRTHRLERPYRSTRAILEFAAGFYRSRLPDDDEPLNLPSPEWLEGIEPGRPPVVVPGGSGEDQLRGLTRELRGFRDGNCDLADVLVLIAGMGLKPEVVTARLNRELGPDTAAEVNHDFFPESAAGVCHLMAATGLERPVVFLLGIDALFAEERNPALNEEERLEKIRDHTRQIYVGFTRAMERLVVFSNAEICSTDSDRPNASSFL